MAERPAGALTPHEAAFDSHPAILDLLWDRLGQGARDRRSAWHTPGVATIGLDDRPEARIMVLRAAHREARMLRLHSDFRAAKARELHRRPAVSLLFYDAAARLQLRARGDARLLNDGAEAEAAWAATRTFSRRCYLAPVAPGATVAEPTSGLPAELEAREPTPAESEAGREHFGVMLVRLDSLEWLFLAHGGHRRGSLRWDGAAWVGDWLVP